MLFILNKFIIFIQFKLLIPLLIIKELLYIIYEYTKNRFIELEQYLEIHQLPSGQMEFYLKKEDMQPPLGTLDYYIPYNILHKRLPQISEL